MLERSDRIVRSLPPVLPRRPRLLILGSMPGAESLRQARYYAHPRNAFWPIVMECLGEDQALPYRGRLARLKRAGVALWDVLASCRRDGSLDSAIRDARPNDIAGLLAAHPGLNGVITNGAAAAAAFRRHILPRLPEPRRRALRLRALPSTSPANAAMPLADKHRLWREALHEMRDGLN